MRDNGRGNIAIQLGILNDIFEELCLNANHELQEVKYITLSNSVNVTELSFIFCK